MSNEYLAKKNKHSNADFEQYLYSASEPRDIVSHGLLLGLESHLLGDNYYIKRRFRKAASRLRG